VPVIALTARSRKGPRCAALAAGMDEYLSSRSGLRRRIPVSNGYNCPGVSDPSSPIRRQVGSARH